MRLCCLFIGYAMVFYNCNVVFYREGMIMRKLIAVVLGCAGLTLYGCEVADGQGNMATQSYVLPQELVDDIVLYGDGVDYKVTAVSTDNGSQNPSVTFSSSASGQYYQVTPVYDMNGNYLYDNAAWVPVDKTY